jgi:acyl-CoA dehydrogenase
MPSLAGPVVQIPLLGHHIGHRARFRRRQRVEFDGLCAGQKLPGEGEIVVCAEALDQVAGPIPGREGSVCSCWARKPPGWSAALPLAARRMPVPAPPAGTFLDIAAMARECWEMNRRYPTRPAHSEEAMTIGEALMEMARPAAVARRSDLLADDCRGLNFYDEDRSFRSLLPFYLEPHLMAHMEPHFRTLGALAGGRLGELADSADRHVPVLHLRDRYGRCEEWIEYHPAYRAMEEIAYGQFGLHAMSHRAGVLGWDAPIPDGAKFALQYLFVQAEFGLLCPVNLTDNTTRLLTRYGSPELKDRYLPGLLSQDMATLQRGAQFMTEKSGGSDVGSSELTAVLEGDHWRLWGEKWFCSNADAEVVTLLARPADAPPGSRGLGLFLMPRTLPDGTRNRYRIVRLKDKLGSRSMASGETLFEGAVAYPLGALDRGLKQMLEMVNQSRLSHGIRAAGMMRRCLNEALAATRRRRAFGTELVHHPLMRRQLMKLMVPTEAALSMAFYTAKQSEQETTSARARQLLRILTPVLKYRACRDNITVATGALEARGGSGYIEDWPNARLVRDAHLGVLWEGTSNIASLDAIRRAVGREAAHRPLQEDLLDRVERAGLPGQFKGRLTGALAQAVHFAERAAGEARNERFSRQAARLLYYAASAVLLACEGAALGAEGGDARRLLLARFVLEHHLTPHDPFRSDGQEWEETAADLLLDAAPVPLERAAALSGA